MAESFGSFTSALVPLPNENVDTDQIIPARFLKTTEKSGLASALFNDWRYEADGSPRPDFILNQPEMQGRQVLLAGDNFGCGSSREHAPWALTSWGIRADPLDELRGHLPQQRAEERPAADRRGRGHPSPALRISWRSTRTPR